jgi:hypothetical protein
LREEEEEEVAGLEAAEEEEVAGLEADAAEADGAEEEAMTANFLLV